MLGVRCDVDILKQTARAQSIYREVYASVFYNPGVTGPFSRSLITDKNSSCSNYNAGLEPDYNETIGLNRVPQESFTKDEKEQHSVNQLRSKHWMNV